MPEDAKSNDDQWDEVWDAREAALSGILAEACGVLHSPIPFFAGGVADVLPFPDFVPGMTYVTAEMTGQDMGQLPSSLGNYELMICVREELAQAANLISNLARYSCDAVLEPGETMDLDAFFGDSTIRAVVFTHPTEQAVRFEFLGKSYGLLLCVGITTEELAFKKARGSASLVRCLKEGGVFPYTIPGRPSVPLPRRGTFLGRIFGR